MSARTFNRMIWVILGIPAIILALWSLGYYLYPDPEPVSACCTASPDAVQPDAARPGQGSGYTWDTYAAPEPTPTKAARFTEGLGIGLALALAALGAIALGILGLFLRIALIRRRRY